MEVFLVNKRVDCLVNYGGIARQYSYSKFIFMQLT